MVEEGTKYIFIYIYIYILKHFVVVMVDKISKELI